MKAKESDLHVSERPHKNGSYGYGGSLTVVCGRKLKDATITVTLPNQMKDCIFQGFDVKFQYEINDKFDFNFYALKK